MFSNAIFFSLQANHSYHPSIAYVAAGTKCRITDSNLYPKEFGGHLGDTQILCMDYQLNSQETVDRLAIGGTTSSTDLVAHSNSGFIIFEDTIDYRLIWAKELYQASYGGQDIKVTSLIIDLDSDFVFAAVWNPAILVQLQGSTGRLLRKKAIFLSSTDYMSDQLKHHSIGYFPSISRFLSYVSDGESKDYLISVNSGDLESSPMSYQLWQGIPNTIARKRMEFHQHWVTQDCSAETVGNIEVSEVTRPSISFSYIQTNSISNADAYIDAQASSIAMLQSVQIEGTGFVRLACLMPNSDIIAGGGSSIDVVLQQNVVAP